MASSRKDNKNFPPQTSYKIISFLPDGTIGIVHEPSGIVDDGQGNFSTFTRARRRKPVQAPTQVNAGTTQQTLNNNMFFFNAGNQAQTPVAPAAPQQPMPAHHPESHPYQTNIYASANNPNTATQQYRDMSYHHGSSIDIFGPRRAVENRQRQHQEPAPTSKPPTPGGNGF